MEENVLTRLPSAPLSPSGRKLKGVDAFLLELRKYFPGRADRCGAWK